MALHIKTDRINVFAECRCGTNSLRKYFGLRSDYQSDGNWYQNAEKNIPNLAFIRHPYTRLKSAISLFHNASIRLDNDFYFRTHGGPYLHSILEMKRKGFRFEIARTEDIHDYIDVFAGIRQHVTDTTLDGIDWTSLPFTKQSIIQEYDLYQEFLETVPKMTPERFKELTL